MTPLRDLYTDPRDPRGVPRPLLWLLALTPAILAAALLLGVVRAEGDDGVRDVIADRAAAHGVSGYALIRLAECESRLDPGAVGGLGEIGLFQLHPRGLLPLFYRLGYDDPWSVYEQSDFAAWAIEHGLARHWSCWR